MSETENGDHKTPRSERITRPPGRRPLIEGSADDTRQTIRRHAIQLFNERGYVSVTMDDIAAAANLTRATLYYHYRSKADIFTETVTIVLGFVQAEVTQLLERRDISVRERLALYIAGRRAGNLPGFAATTEVAVSETMVWATLPHLSPRYQARVTEKLNALHQVTCALFAEGVENGELRPMPPQVLDYAFWQLFDPASYPEETGMLREAWETHLMAIFMGTESLER